ncbi:hypothetical protein R1flu_012557 [Riccia fluitans]|uniref:Uncharacterized protein n=1 Tax=Riccia fluitans TaxID=41844 RepID=A0ABD1ZAX7_9MARC
MKGILRDVMGEVEEIPKREDSSSRKESPRQDQPHRVGSPVKEKRREYLSKVGPYMFGEAERDYNSLCRRYSNLIVVPEFAKLLVLWTEKEFQFGSISRPSVLG